MTEVFDFVIAGAGSAGCALAARLAEDGRHTVCLVEAGGPGRSLWSRMPAGNGFLFGNPRHDWGLRSVPQPGLAGRSVFYPRGKGVGGSSLMNGMIYMRGTAGDYDRWRRKGLAGWSYAEVLPYFRRSAGAAHRAGDPYHGRGPLRLTPAGNFDAVNARFVQACIEAGAARNADFNGASQAGAGRIDTKVWRGRRQSAAEAYLARPPAGLTIRTGTPVHRVLLDGRRAVGLALAGAELRARREVILCLGAFGSPQVLMRSGIGPAAHLADMGIAVVHDLPGVGSTLLDHPQYPMKRALRDPALSLARHQRAGRAVALGLRYLLAGTGPGAAPFWSSALFHALRDAENPELQVYLTPMCVTEEAAAPRLSPAALLNIGTLILARGKAALPGLQFDICLLRPRSAGTVRLAGPSPETPPAIDPAWFSDPADMDDMIAGIRHMRRVAAQPALAGIVAGETQPAATAETDAALEAAVRAHASTGHHPVATCRMGAAHDPGAVLDEALRVRGIDRLRVVDASAFADQIGGNPGAPVLMLAEKAADMILGRPAPAPEDPRAGRAEPASGEAHLRAIAQADASP
ncbi:MAG: GMC family oxidoreductase N-terminal domain-containing protein [Pseudomonadota bacterium]